MIDEKFMTESVLKSVLDEFEWPEPYHLEDDLPDGITMVFPKCRLYFVEGVDAVHIKFLSEDTGFEKNLTHKDALQAIRSRLGDADPMPKLIGDMSPASIARVRNSVRDLCTLVLTYLRPTLAGDFGWVETARLQYYGD